MVDSLLVVDPEKCSGCGTCEIWCSINHERQSNPSLSRIRVIKQEFQGVFIPVVCQQCEKAMCKDVCPVLAIYEDPHLGITIDEIKCVGCRMCTLVCPYGAIEVDNEKSVAVKCDLCNGDPLCAKFCPTEAIKYLRGNKVSMKRKIEAMQKISEVMMRARTERKVVSDIGLGE